MSVWMLIDCSGGGGGGGRLVVCLKVCIGMSGVH